MRTPDGARQQLAAVGGPQLELHLQVRQCAASAEVLLADGRRVNAAQPRLQPLLPAQDLAWPWVRIDSRWTKLSCMCRRSLLASGKGLQGDDTRPVSTPTDTVLTCRVRACLRYASQAVFQTDERRTRKFCQSRGYSERM